MILYFSGTGNSAYVAEKIAKATKEQTLNLLHRIKSNDHSRLYSDQPWVLVVPTYAWRIPHIVETWLSKTELAGNNKIYFVMTCGGKIGSAGEYLKSLCLNKNMDYMGCTGIIMPENYIAMFATPSKAQAIAIIDKAEPQIDQAINCITSGITFPDLQITAADKLYSGMINRLFYPVFVHAKKFYVTQDCISCGLCEKNCPLNNIRLIDGKPNWSDTCTHCMACISRCPKEAIEYQKHSEGLPRYTCPK